MELSGREELITCRLGDESRMPVHSHPYIEIFYLMSGSGSFSAGENQFKANANDFFIVHVGEPHAFTGTVPCLHVCFQIDPGILLKISGQDNLLFCVNPGAWNMGAETFARLSALLLQLIHLKLERDPYMILMNRAFSYQILYLLLQHAQEKQENRPEDKKYQEEQRILKIRQYLYSHFREPISLHGLAEYMFLSDAYLSKYIKKNFGQNFLSFLYAIRAENACIELVRFPDRSVLQIALDNGFPNISAFNKSFQKIYRITPIQYRKEQAEQLQKKQEKKAEAEILERTRELVEEQLKKMNPVQIYSQEVIFSGNAVLQNPLLNNWSVVLNAGQLGELLRSDIQEHILYLVQNLHFQYIRVWDVFSNDMFFNIEDGTGNYNFVKLDRIFDFLIRNHIKPFLELQFKPIILMKTLDEKLVNEERKCIFSSLKQHDAFLEKLIQHLCMRYGEEEVNSWYFEVWWSKNNLDESCEAYLRLFDHTVRPIKKYAPKASVGGAGFELLESSAQLEQFLNQWRMQESQPDFLSVYAYPYTVNGEKLLIDGRRIQNENYVREWTAKVREIADRTGYGETGLYVTEWNFSVSSRNMIHDSCFMGAYIVKNVIAMIGRADVISWWRGSDLHSEYFDDSAILYGGEGLISRDKIGKPAYYALDFLNHLRGSVIGRGENYVITRYKEDDYRIVCCNYQHPNIRYYQVGENIQDSGKLDDFFTNQMELTAKIQIRCVLPGTYRIKTRRINREAGSVQDEWSRICTGSEEGEEDITYLKSICIPRMSVRETESGELLEFLTSLRAQEIQYIHIRRI
ncbi:MAG: helix-turn-helix domain-containing protein [Oliverpabstia sp.]